MSRTPEDDDVLCELIVFTVLPFKGKVKKKLSSFTNF